MTPQTGVFRHYSPQLGGSERVQLLDARQPENVQPLDLTTPVFAPYLYRVGGGVRRGAPAPEPSSQTNGSYLIEQSEKGDPWIPTRGWCLPL